MEVNNRTENDALVEQVRKPEFSAVGDNPILLVPPGYGSSNVIDLEKYLPAPLRRRGTITLDDADSFIRYCVAQGIEGQSRIYCKADYEKSRVEFIGVLNDYHDEPEWQDFRAVYAPATSVEWKRWTGNDRKPFGQVEFATWLEDNNKDIASVTGFPTGAEMLTMAKSLEINQDMRIKSSIRLQSGGVSLEYVSKDDDATVTRMSVFERFALGIAPFFNGQAYQLEARLKYKSAGGTVQFWYELVRPDLVVQDATRELITVIGEKTAFPVLMGRVGA